MSPKPRAPLARDELQKIDAYWRACNYLAAGMIYLRENPLLRQPLRPEHIKSRLLGHWGSSPGLSFIYLHMNRLINKYDLNAIFLAGPGHGTPGVLAATVLLREHFPDLKIRFINVVNLYKLAPQIEHPHGLSERDFDSLFTTNKPVIFNFHGYPWLIHRLAYRRTNHKNMHVRGYKEKGNINTPLELAIQNEIDRFSLAIDVIDRVPGLSVIGAHAKETLREMQYTCREYVHHHGVDLPEANDWSWPY